MVNRSQFVRKPRLQWSLMLAVLLGLCSLSAPHLLGHAHAHHISTGGVSRGGGNSHRSRSGSNNADGEHDSDAVAAFSAFDPHTPDHDVALVAVVPSALLAPVQWIALDGVSSHNEAPASVFSGSPHRGRAPPVA